MPIEIFPHKLYKDIIDVNLVGTINVCSTFINLMDKNVHSPIINISSIAAHIPNLNTIYTASKYGVEGFTSSLSKELSNTKIRVNAICPGLIETDMTRNTIPDDSLWDKYSQLQPIGIKLKPEHVADLVELLFDPRSSCIGGQSIQIG
jgi:3-oxoacyl-[acyl-carrier protein] reductase